MRFNAFGGQSGLTQHQRQRHREASRMCSTDEFFRIGTFSALKAGLEAIRCVLEYARLGGDGAASILDATFPDRPRRFLDHVDSLAHRRRLLSIEPS